MSVWKRWSAAALVSMTLWTGASAAANSVEMLREMFRTPVTEWKQTLRDNSRLLNGEFFTSVDKRIRWGLENNHVDDAFRFAMVGDFSCEAVNKPANYRIDLAEGFFKAQNDRLAGQIVDNIMITSAGTEPALRAQFLRGELKERAQDLFGAYQEFHTLAEQKYRPADTWYKCALISGFIGKEEQARAEYQLAANAGSQLAMNELEKIKARDAGGFDSLEPLANSDGTPIQMPDTANMPDVAPPPDNPRVNTNPDRTPPAVVASSGDDLEKAREAAKLGKLDDAAGLYEKVFNDGKDAEVSREFGAVLYRMGALDLAKSVYDEALGRNKNDVELLRGRANTLERMYDRTGQKNDLTAAVRDYKQAKTLDPGHELLPWELSRAESKN